ncbi:MAG: hypothetical protein K2J80_05645 [Oscillospiraceae bacterium]|nr:hypothetical protein [Oscillospiraceae bacterium]
MKIKKLLLCLAALAMCLTVCGCSMSVSVENLLSPPKLTEEQNEIYQELISSVGRNIKLKYPRSGDYRSAFVIKDIDGEPGSEALVFYESKDIRSGESALRLKFLDKSNGKWEAAYDLACPGNEIESVVFADLGGNTVAAQSSTAAAPTVILSYTLLNQSEKAFSVLKYKDKQPHVLLSSTYSCMEITDLNKDKQNELVIVSVNKELQTASASMYTDGGDKLELLSNTPLYGGAADYIRVTKGNLDESTSALFLDYSKGGGQSGTDVLYCYGSRLFCPDSIGSNPAAGTISRQVNDYMAEIYSFDINNDGFVEIPSTTPLPGYETLTKPEQLCAVQWYTVQNDNFTQRAYSYFSGKYRFALLFPNRWRGVVSAVPDFNNNTIIFIAYNAETGLIATEDNEIMRIHTIEKDDKEAVEAAKGMKFLGESDDLLFYCAENERCRNGELALTESELNDSFVIL